VGTFYSWLLDVAGFTTQTVLLLLILYKPSFPVVRLEISTLPPLTLKSWRKKKYVVLREFIKYMFWFLIETALHIIRFFLCWGMNIQNSEVKPVLYMTFYHQQTLPSVIPMYKKILFLIHDFHSHFHRKCIIACWFFASPLLPDLLYLH
jgi:hypothetical protein